MINNDLACANNLLRSGQYEEALNYYSRLKESKPWLSDIIDFNINLCRKKIECLVELSHFQPKIRTKGIYVGIASIPERESALCQTIQSLINQVDYIGVYLDGYQCTPKFLESFGKKVSCIHSSEVGRDLGDAGKFLWIENHDGYYFTCDDDLIYPNDYVSRTIECINSYKSAVVVGWHGSYIMEKFHNYYDKNSRRVLTFGSQRAKNTNVHILGTGCLGFNTSSINVKLEDFKTPNMADVYFAILGQVQRVPFILIKHERGEILEIEASQSVSINKHSASNIVGSRQNTKDIQNRLVKNQSWRLFRPDRSLRITIIGRYNTHQKGGIFKSSSLLAKHLRILGHKVDEICCSDTTKLTALKSGDAQSDFILAYAPDPKRPDFGELLDVISAQANKGVVCAVNFSINKVSERSKWIKDNILLFNKDFSAPRIFVAAFTNSSSLIDSDLAAISEYIVTLPKTLDPGVSSNKNYHQRQGIFLGDLAKLVNNDLVFGDAKKWIEQIRVNLPHVDIYAVKHYNTDKVLLDYLKILPYSADGISDVLSSIRLCVCLTPGATFEMIPVEAAMLGTPVIHRSMPQSLGEYLSPVSIEVANPKELGAMCALIYEREDLWERLSESSKGLYHALHINNLSAAIEVGIRKCLTRAGAFDL